MANWFQRESDNSESIKKIFNYKLYIIKIIYNLLLRFKILNYFLNYFLIILEESTWKTPNWNHKLLFNPYHHLHRTGCWSVKTRYNVKPSRRVWNLQLFGFNYLLILIWIFQHSYFMKLYNFFLNNYYSPFIITITKTIIITFYHCELINHVNL